MLLLGLVTSLAQAGPHAVTWEDVELDGGELVVPARVYRPSEGGPYPLAGFLHGWLGSAWMYDEVCAELASWGFVVASLDTQTGLFLETERYAAEAQAMFAGVEARARTPGDPLEGLVADGDRVAFGHSMGGATLMRWLALDPKIRTAVAFMPYQGYGEYYDGLRYWDGSLLVLSGTHDTTAPPSMQHEWLDAADAASRALLVEVTDMGHQSVTDLNFEEDPMPDALQRAIVLELATTFVRAEHGGDEALWAELIGPGVAELDAAFRSRSRTPALWTALDGDALSLGLAAFEGEQAELFFGRVDASGVFVEEVSGGALEVVDGVAPPATVQLPAGWEGDLWAAARIEGAWTRAVPLVDAPDPGGDPSVPVDAEDPARAVRDSSGCATSPAPTSAWVALALVAWRRRWRPAPETRRGRSSTSPSGTSCSAATTRSATSTSRRSST